MSSTDYYNNHAEDFYRCTIGLDMSSIYEKFLSYLPSRAKILDAGCGVGRDSRYFQNLGHEVVAFDAALEMVKRSSQILDQPVLHLRFEDIAFSQEFDGVWACASLLHVAYEDTPTIFTKIHQALKPDGIFYASYKYGHEKRVDGERTFYNMDEKKIASYWDPLFETFAFWKTQAQPTQIRPDDWLNCLGRKKGHILS